MTDLVTRSVLFDLDGVLVDSSATIWQAWKEWAAHHGLDADATFAMGHGRQTLDHIRVAAPHLANAAEEKRIDDLEARYADAVRPLPGAAALVSQLDGTDWGVVTSCSAAAATVRLAQAGIPTPRVLVHAEQVARGKPAPDGYLLGAHLIGVDPADVVVFEDSPTGISAAKAAGMRVVAVSTTHPEQELSEAGWRIRTLADVRVAAAPAGRTVLSLG